MASTHPAIVVGHSDEVIATGSGVGIDQELRHVQFSAGNPSYSMRVVKCQVYMNKTAMLCCWFDTAQYGSFITKDIFLDILHIYI